MKVISSCHCSERAIQMEHKTLDLATRLHASSFHAFPLLLMSQKHSCCCANKRKQILPKSLPVTPDAKAMPPCSSVLAYTRSCSSSPSSPLTDVFHCPVYRELWPATRYTPKSTKIHEAATLQHLYSKTLEHSVWGSLTAFLQKYVMLSGQCMPCMLSTLQYGRRKNTKKTFNLACVCQSLTALVSLCSTLQLHVPCSSPKRLWKTIQAC